jgi:protein-disulfide isomerase
VVFKHWPLGTACNDALTRDLHPQACAAASAAVAAHRQDRFWVFQDEVFAVNLRQEDDVIMHLVEQLEMDLQQFERDVGDAATAAKIKSDVELGKRLGVDATPSLFLNGRRLPDNRPQTIRLLIAHEVERKSK